MLQYLLPVAATALGGYLFVSRGKAHIGDTVEVMWKPGAQYGEQGLLVTGKVTEKTNPILGPYYSIQLFKAPEIPALENMTNPDFLQQLKASIPSTIGGLKDADIVRNLSRK